MSFLIFIKLSVLDWKALIKLDRGKLESGGDGKAWRGYACIQSRPASLDTAHRDRNKALSKSQKL